MAHTHSCPDCGTPVDCGGELERNDDGWPEVICEVAHVFGVRRCDDCEVGHQRQAAADAAENV